MSFDPDTTCSPFGDTATLLTHACPSSVATQLPVATFHTLSVLSCDPETTRRPSGDTATHSTLSECPSSVATHLPVAKSHTLSVQSSDPDTTRRPSGDTATPRTYDEDTSSQKYSGRRAPHGTHVPFQRRHALAGRHVPHLERPVHRRRNDAPPVRKHGNALDLRRRHIITKAQWTPCLLYTSPSPRDRTRSRMPSSA